MQLSFLLWLLLAVLVFWSVGVYNRLMRMRAHGLDAFGSVEKLLRQHLALISRHLESNPVEDLAPGAQQPPNALWRTLQTQLQNVDGACKAVRAEPLRARPLKGVADVMTQTQATWAELMASPQDLAGPAVPPDFQQQWEDIQLRLTMAVQAFNQIVDRYNQSLHEFPASLVAGIFGFRDAGRL